MDMSKVVDEDIKMVVYCVTNKVNQKKYVGITTRSLKKRMWEHKTVKRQCPITSAIRKYGHENFEVRVLEKCESEDELVRRELEWIEELKTVSPNGYNVLCKKCCIGKVRLGSKNSKKHKLILSERMRFLKDEYVKIHQKDWVVVTPGGEIKNVTNLQKFCRDNDLDAANMVKLTTQRRGKFHKGWQCFKKEDFLESDIKAFQNGFKAYFEDGSEEIFKGSVGEYCRQNDYDISSVYKIVRGELKKYKSIIGLQKCYVE